MEKCLTIVGRSRTANKFSETFIEALVETVGESDFEIESVEYLGDFSEIDGMARYIAFVLVNDDAKRAMKIERLFSTLTNLQLGVRLFENLADAKSYSEEHYMTGDMEDNGEEIDEDDLDEDVDEEKFPRFTAKEIEDFFMFESLFRTGKLVTLRGSIADKPVVIMAQVVEGPDQTRVTPYIVMINSDLLEELELPKINERD